MLHTPAREYSPAGHACAEHARTHPLERAAPAKHNITANSGKQHHQASRYSTLLAPGAMEQVRGEYSLVGNLCGAPHRTAMFIKLRTSTNWGVLLGWACVRSVLAPLWAVLLVVVLPAKVARDMHIIVRQALPSFGSLFLVAGCFPSFFSVVSDVAICVCVAYCLLQAASDCVARCLLLYVGCLWLLPALCSASVMFCWLPRGGCCVLHIVCCMWLHAGMNSTRRCS